MTAINLSRAPGMTDEGPVRAQGLNDTLLIATGSTVGQLLVVIAMPVITRLYEPTELGLYAIFSALVGLFATVVALHYELAIPLPRSDSQARVLTKIALLTVGGMGLLAIGAILALGDVLFKRFNSPELSAVQWLIPASLTTSGIITVLTYRAIRIKAYRLTAIGKVLQGIVQPCAQMLYGILGYGASGLIYGSLVGQCATVYALVQNGFGREIRYGWHSHKTKFVALAGKYKNFPTISTPSSFINAAVTQLPVIALAAWFDMRIVGLYALGARILQVPMRFIGDSLSQVFFSQAASAFRNGTLCEVVLKTWRVQTTFALHTFLPVAIVAPEVFGNVFGQTWREAGVYTQLLMPWIMASFVSTSLSILVTILQKQKQEFVFQVIYLSVLPCTLWFARFETSGHLAIGLLGGVASALLAGKIIWLLTIAGVQVRFQSTWLAREILYVTAAISVLLFIKIVGGSEMVTLCAAAVLVVGMHGVNHLVRNAYSF